MIKVILTKEERDRVRRHAQLAQVGGVSRVREGADRQASLGTDQFVGMLGEAAYTLFRFGSIERWCEQRERQNKNPRLGDGGKDVAGEAVDVKTSLMRDGQDPMGYNFLVRPKERHAGSRYVQCLIPLDFSCVYICGYVDDGELTEPEVGGKFGPLPVYRKAISELHPIR